MFFGWNIDPSLRNNLVLFFILVLYFKLYFIAAVIFGYCVFCEWDEAESYDKEDYILVSGHYNTEEAFEAQLIRFESKFIAHTLGQKGLYGGIIETWGRELRFSKNFNDGYSYDGISRWSSSHIVGGENVLKNHLELLPIMAMDDNGRSFYNHFFVNKVSFKYKDVLNVDSDEEFSYKTLSDFNLLNMYGDNLEMPDVSEFVALEHVFNDVNLFSLDYEPVEHEANFYCQVCYFDDYQAEMYDKLMETCIFDLLDYSLSLTKSNFSYKLGKIGDVNSPILLKFLYDKALFCYKHPNNKYIFDGYLSKYIFSRRKVKGWRRFLLNDFNHDSLKIMNHDWNEAGIDELSLNLKCNFDFFKKIKYNYLLIYSSSSMKRFLKNDFNSNYLKRYLNKFVFRVFYDKFSGHFFRQNSGDTYYLFKLYSKVYNLNKSDYTNFSNKFISIYMLKSIARLLSQIKSIKSKKLDLKKLRFLYGLNRFNKHFVRSMFYPRLALLPFFSKRVKYRGKRGTRDMSALSRYSVVLALYGLDRWIERTRLFRFKVTKNVTYKDFLKGLFKRIRKNKK